MNIEVLAQGDDEGRRPPGRAVGIVVTLALLGVVGVAVARSRHDGTPDPGATPTPERTTSFTSTAGGSFGEFTTMDPPDTSGDPVPFRLDNGAGVFLLPGIAGLPRAVGAAGGPPWAPVVVGWCGPERTFRDEAGTYVYDEDGNVPDGFGWLPRHEVRYSAEGGRIDVADVAEELAEGPTGSAAAGPCPAPLTYPPRPEPASGIFAARDEYRVLSGRYVVTLTTRRFCAVDTHPRCLAGGWEDYGHGLPFDDVAAAYVWEGELLVHADPDTGRLETVRLPGARLVDRDGVGHDVTTGRVTSADLDGDSVRIEVERADDTRGFVTERFVVPPTADVHLPGVTGIGRPRATPDRLWEYLTSSASTRDVAIVRDRDGTVIRVAVNGPG